jgi:hypothetical protein
VWYFYNAHVLNEYLTAKDRRQISAAYERDFKKYQKLPQPKNIAIDANIDIFPERRSFSGAGHFVLQNKTAQPIRQIHITDQRQSLSDLRFDRPFHAVSTSPRGLYSIYQLDTPLAPGDKLNLTFHVGYASRGFRDGNERPELAYSGTFFDSSYFPTIGYDSGIELDDPRRRRNTAFPSRISFPSVAIPRAPSPTSSPHSPTGSVSVLPSAPPTTRSPSPPAILPATGMPTAATISPTTWAT